MRKTSRMISLLLAMAMVVFILPVNVFAADTPDAEISVQSITAVPGSTVEVPLIIKNNPGILGATITLSYSSELTLIGVENGSAFSTLNFTKPGVFTSPCNLFWDGLEIAEDDIRDGTIAVLTFEVSETVEEGAEQNIVISSVPGDIRQQGGGKSAGTGFCHFV